MHSVLFKYIVETKLAGPQFPMYVLINWLSHLPIDVEVKVIFFFFFCKMIKSTAVIENDIKNAGLFVVVERIVICRSYVTGHVRPTSNCIFIKTEYTNYKEANKLN